jgi:ferredoxin-NADP reductase
MSADYRDQIEGYEEILSEIASLRKYGIDYATTKGKKAEIVNRLHPEKCNLRISRIIEIAKDVKVFRLVSQNGYLPPFIAGQYISLPVEINGVRTSRPYSISSSPKQRGYYEITIKLVPDGFVSQYLFNDAKVGDIFEAASPAGHFYYNPLFHGSKLVFIAGGSGITPFMSMLREMSDLGLDDKEIHLIYGCQSEEDAFYQKELLEYVSERKNFTYDRVLSSPREDFKGLTGFIDSKVIMRLVPQWQTSTYYICGPSAMYKFCVPELKKLGVPQKRIRREVFSSRQNIADEPGWPESISTEDVVHLKLGDRVFSAKAGESIMTALEKNKITVKSCCRSGECSLCRVKLNSGKVFQPESVLVRKSDRKYGYIHSCQSYPLSDVEIQI